MKRVVLSSESETAILAREFAEVVRSGDSVGLSGDLGAGKTTFVRYLIGAMGGNVGEVSSPSYTLQHEYKLPSGLVIEHWDLYRLRETPDELREPPAAGVVRLLEWPERCPGLNTSLSLHCAFIVRDDGAREVEIASAVDESRLAGIKLDRTR